MARGPFSQRVPASLEPGPWARRLAALRAQGRALIDLTDFNPTTAGLDLLADFALDGTGAYEPDPAGLRVAREAVCAYYRDRGVEVDPSHVILTASTSEAYAHAFRLLCEPGEAFLVPRPSYPLIDALAQAEGCRVEPYAWELAGDAWAIAPLTMPADVRAIVAVNPNHPTGAFLTHEDAAVLLRACAQRGIPLVVDEVFSDFPWYGGRPASQLATSMLRERLEGRAPQPLKLVFSGLSKVCGLPQLKLGWIVVQGEPFERDAALERVAWLSDTFLSVAQPVQRALPALLAGRARFQGSVRARVARNRGALAKAVDALPDASLLPADAGWSAVVALPGMRTDEEWALALLEHDVIVHPGYFYGFEQPGRIVVSLLLPPAAFDAAIAALFAVGLG
jgi:aspartate/methionine/tyrosine aminotransferase